MKHSSTLRRNDDGSFTGTCESNDWTLTDNFDLVLVGARDHQFEKDHGVILD